MNQQCQNCFSTSFPAVKQTRDGHVLSCTHCAGWDVQKFGFGVRLCTFTFTEPVQPTSNVVKLEQRTSR